VALVVPVHSAGSTGSLGLPASSSHWHWQHEWQHLPVTAVPLPVHASDTQAVSGTQAGTRIRMCCCYKFRHWATGTGIFILCLFFIGISHRDWHAGASAMHAFFVTPIAFFKLAFPYMILLAGLTLWGVSSYWVYGQQPLPRLCR
jgi:hypothetical protein